MPVIAKIPTLKFKFDPNSLPPAGCNLALCLAIRVPSLKCLAHIAPFLRDDSKEENYALFVHRLVSEAAEINRVTVGWPVVKPCVFLPCQRGRNFKPWRVPILKVRARNDCRPNTTVVDTDDL